MKTGKSIVKYIVYFSAIGAGVSLSALGLLGVLAEALTVQVTKPESTTEAKTETVNEQ